MAYSPDSIQFATRSKEGGLQVWDVREDIKEGCIKQTILKSFPDPSPKAFRWSPCGQFIWISTQDKLTQYFSDGKDNFEVFLSLDLPFLQEFSFQNIKDQGKTLLCTLQKPLATAGTVSGVEKNLKIFVLNNQTFKLLMEVPGKTLMCFLKNDLLLRWTPGTQDTQVLSLTVDSALSTKVHRLDGKADALSAHGDCLVVFSKEAPGKPATLTFYKLVDADGNLNLTKLTSKSLFGCDRVDFKWIQVGGAANTQTKNPGSRVLVLAHSEHDKSNQSYYGEDRLFLMGSDLGEFIRVSLSRDGPIHDVAWHPKGAEFAVIHGFMPAQTALHDGASGNHIWTLPAFATGFKNTIRFSQDGSFLAFGGFGNVAGGIEVWSRHRMTCEGTIPATNATLMEWSITQPLRLGNFLITATLTPRLRVDNAVGLWSWRGGSVPIAHLPFSELYHVAWRPGWCVFPDKRPLSLSLQPAVNIKENGQGAASSPSTTSTSSGAYRPPSLRSKPSALTRDSEGRLTINGQELSATKGTKGFQQMYPSPAQQPKNDTTSRTSGVDAAKNKSLPPPAPTSISKEERAVRRIREKLAQIEDLKVRAREGEILEKNQLSKLAGEASLQAELEQALKALKI